MIFSESDIPGTSLNRRPPAYETYQPRSDLIREALCVACMFQANRLKQLTN